jgi:hypothetical protein
MNLCSRIYLPKLIGAEFTFKTWAAGEIKAGQTGRSESENTL